MYRFFEQLSSRIAAPFVGDRSRNSKVWPCRCGQSLFFRNSQCLACLAALGYQPEQSRLTSLQPGEQAGTWTLDADPQPGCSAVAPTLTPRRPAIGCCRTMGAIPCASPVA